MGQGIAGHVAATGEVIRVDHADSCPHHERALMRKLGITTRSVLCVPIKGDDRILGALELLNKPSGFDEGDERLATLVAGQTGPGGAPAPHRVWRASEGAAGGAGPAACPA